MDDWRGLVVTLLRNTENQVGQVWRRYLVVAQTLQLVYIRLIICGLQHGYFHESVSSSRNRSHRWRLRGNHFHLVGSSRQLEDHPILGQYRAFGKIPGEYLLKQGVCRRRDEVIEGELSYPALIYQGCKVVRMRVVILNIVKDILHARTSRGLLESLDNWQ